MKRVVAVMALLLTLGLQGCGDHSDSSNQSLSGIDRNKSLQALTPAEEEQLCDWSWNIIEGHLQASPDLVKGHRKHCGYGSNPQCSVSMVEDCVASLSPTQQDVSTPECRALFDCENAVAETSSSEDEGVTATQPDTRTFSVCGKRVQLEVGYPNKGKNRAEMCWPEGAWWRKWNIGGYALEWKENASCSAYDLGYCEKDLMRECESWDPFGNIAGLRTTFERAGFLGVHYECGFTDLPTSLPPLDCRVLCHGKGGWTMKLTWLE